MPSSKSFILAALACVAGTASAQVYTLVDTYDSTNFFNDFTFYTGADPTDGYVDYTVGTSNGLAYYTNNQIYMGVDYTTVNPSGGRASTRVTSNTAYTHGLFVADIAHMPGAICGVWPAWWTFGPNWPASGEIDIIEGVNQQTTDSITLHTAAGCDVSISGSAAGTTLGSSDCNDNSAGTGCSASTTNTEGYGNGFNSAGGGFYAMNWNSESISVYFWPRGSEPSGIDDGQPEPSNWSPVATFSGCDIDEYFANHNIIFDTTFCGQWAGEVWSSGSCASAADTCDDYVGANPSAFTDAYWLVNSVKVYTDPSSKMVKRNATGVF